MPTSFRMPFQVIQRPVGTWTNGLYVLSYDYSNVKTVQATVQMPSTGDMMAIEANPWGRRAGRYIKIYCDERLSVPQQATQYNGTTTPTVAEYVGDLFVYDNRQYLLFGEADFTMLKRSRATPVSHWRYYGCEVVERIEIADNGP